MQNQWRRNKLESGAHVWREAQEEIFLSCRSQTLSEWLASEYSVSSSTTNWRQLTTLATFCQRVPSTVCTSRSSLSRRSRSVLEGCVSGYCTSQNYLLLATWSGLCTAADRIRLNSFLRKCVKLGYFAPTNHRRSHSLPTMQRTLSSKMYSETLNTYCSPTWKSDRSCATNLEIDPESTSLCSR